MLNQDYSINTIEFSVKDISMYFLKGNRQIHEHLLHKKHSKTCIFQRREKSQRRCEKSQNGSHNHMIKALSLQCMENKGVGLWLHGCDLILTFIASFCGNYLALDHFLPSYLLYPHKSCSYPRPTDNFPLHFLKALFQFLLIYCII